MRNIRAPIISSLLLIAWMGGQPLRALDWPQWRGADRTDLSKETGLLKQWPAAGPTRLWLYRNAGAGYSGFSISRGKVFTMATRDDMEHVLALDEQSGRELWAASLTAALFLEAHGDGPRGTPTVDGDRVYALGSKGTVICVNFADGKVVWKVAMQDFGGAVPMWGYAESVLVDGDKLICTPGGSRGAMVALDKQTGKLIWQSKGFADPAQYASIVPATINGVWQYVQLTMQHVVGVRAADGQLLWESEWPGQVAVIPTPIVRDNLVYFSSGYSVGNKQVRIGPNNRAEDSFARNNVMKNHHGGVILVGDYLYGYSGGGGDNAGSWVCQNFRTGARVWSSTAFGKGAITFAEGMLYGLDESSGMVVLFEASPTGWKEHGRFRLDPQSRNHAPSGLIWTHPVVSNGKLFLRDQEFISCYDIKAK